MNDIRLREDASHRGGSEETKAAMPAITLWQPWGSLWCSPAKIHETRHWSTPHRGWLLVHAAKRKLDDESAGRLDSIMDEHFGHHWGLEIPFGALIGMVNVVDCVRVETLPRDHHESDDYQCGDFSAGRFAWRRSEFKAFARPVPYKGARGFFNVPRAVFEHASFVPASVEVAEEPGRSAAEHAALLKAT